MKRFMSLLAAIAVAVSAMVTTLSPTPAYANAIIDSAKAQCIIGERTDGYLGVVSGKSATAEQRREMRSVNQQRRAAYERLAARNGVTVAVAAQLTAEKLINQAPRGQCVQDSSGQWVQK
ncbi:MAG: YdbL family protein [Pseudomonadota bacterium]